LNAPLETACDLTVVLRSGDDEERIGHAIGKLTAHLRGLGCSFELLVADEGSGDNTLAVAALLRKTSPELATLHADPGRGFVAGAHRARGRLVAVLDVREDLPLALLGYALGKAERGADVVTVAGKLVVFRRTRCLRALDALSTSRRAAPSRFVRRARGLRLGVAELHPRRTRILDHLRSVLLAPAALWL